MPLMTPADAAAPGLLGQLSDLAVEDSLIVFLLTIVANLAWRLTSWLVQLGRYYFSPAVAQLRLDLGEAAALAGGPGGARFYCQIVRFGADDYLRDMASEQERFEGRLQNRVLPVDLDGRRAEFLLPVHRRLGTQFKMYLLAPGSDQAKALMEAAYFAAPERRAKRRGRRISFVLTEVDSTENAEGSTANNIMYPSNLHDFTDWNRFGRLYVWLQRQRWRRAERRLGRDPDVPADTD